MNKNLMSERIRAGLSREEVAAKLGKTADLIGRWERGVSSPLVKPDGMALARLYGCSIDYLAGLTDTRH